MNINNLIMLLPKDITDIIFSFNVNHRNNMSSSLQIIKDIRFCLCCKKTIINICREYPNNFCNNACYTKWGHYYDDLANVDILDFVYASTQLQ